MVIEALKAARDFIENDRQALAESLTVNGEIVFEDDTDRRAMAEYVNVLGVIDQALKASAQPAPVQEWGGEQLQMLNFLYGSGEWDGLGFEQKHPTKKGAFWWRSDLRRLFTTPPAQPAPVQSCFCQNCEDQGKEIQSLKATNAQLLQAITKTVQENLHLADGDNCTLVHLVRALGPDDPSLEAPLTREELRAMWIGRETGWGFYVNVDARLFGRKDTTTINPPKETNV
jgi:hypothetical protein